MLAYGYFCVRKKDTPHIDIKRNRFGENEYVACFLLFLLLTRMLFPVLSYRVTKSYSNHSRGRRRRGTLV